jgi:glycosyltransferase involved in cell wall biosynthesis
MRQDVTAVIPAYQCAATIAAVVRGLRHHLEEVVVVDDGSSDDTAAQAAEAGARVVRLPENRGKGYALREGIRQALAGEPAAIVLLDGDGQHAPEDLPAMLDAWSTGAGDLVIGARLADPSRIPSLRYWTNYIGTRILSWMTGRELEDSQSGYRLLSAELLRRLPLDADDYAIESEMLIRAARRGARIAHVPVRTIYGAETSHYRPVRDTVRIALRAIRVKAFDED